MANRHSALQNVGWKWESLAEGWRHLMERVSESLTRFHPVRHEVETPGALVARHAPHWALLAAEVRENGDYLVIKLELPGMEAEQINVDIIEDFLVIRGEKRVEREEAKGRYYKMECAYGLFERSIQLPMPVDPSRARARYRNGVLTVNLPKSASTQTRRIQVDPA
ncbi:HSP20 family protein [Gammaproteobacteria bacterium]